jgi:hypothetical protein
MDICLKSVVRSLKVNKKPSISLLTNPLKTRIIHSGGSYYYVDPITKNHQILSGLLPSLKSCFWPNVDMNIIMKKPKKTFVFKRDQKKKKKEKNKNKGKGRHYGLIKGSEIHQQLEDFVFMNKKSFIKKHEGIHPWAKEILKFIEKMNWIPLQSEYHVYDLKLLIGTSIDMICVDSKTGKLILLEFKTGYKSYFENNDGNMEDALNFMENSPLNWATIQLIFSIVMLMKQQKERPEKDKLCLKDIEPYIIRIDDDCLDVYTVDNTFIEIMTKPLYKSLYNSRAIVKRNKMKKVR